LRDLVLAVHLKPNLHDDSTPATYFLKPSCDKQTIKINSTSASITLGFYESTEINDVCCYNGQSEFYLNYSNSPFYFIIENNCVYRIKISQLLTCDGECIAIDEWMPNEYAARCRVSSSKYSFKCTARTKSRKTIKFYDVTDPCDPILISIDPESVHDYCSPTCECHDKHEHSRDCGCDDKKEQVCNNITEKRLKSRPVQEYCASDKDSTITPEHPAQMLRIETCDGYGDFELVADIDSCCCNNDNCCGDECDKKNLFVVEIKCGLVTITQLPNYLNKCVRTVCFKSEEEKKLEKKR